MSAPEAIRLEGIHVSYGRRRPTEVLRGLDLRVPCGACRGLVGATGSGKSTLARVILGLQQPRAGQVFIGGVPRDHRRRSAAERGVLSVVFQDYRSSVNPRFPVASIISETLPREVAAVRARRRDATVELLCLVGLDSSFIDRFPHQLSGGQLQRVCIARSIAARPRIVVFDEAVSSLDVAVQVQVMDLLSDLRKRLGLTYVFITHDLAAVTYLCDSVSFLHGGRIVEECDDITRLFELRDQHARAFIDAVALS